jgi:GABA permease
MLFVLAARREAPVQLIRVNNRGVPMGAILASSVVGFLCVIAAAVSPDTVFLFLLNSSGAIILFVYLMICLSQIILRRRTDPAELRVKMWLFPALSLLTTAAIVAVLVQMAFSEDTLSQLLLSLLAWAVVIVLYLVTKWRGGSVEPSADPEPTGVASRVLVLANETLTADELLQELRRIDRERKAQYYVCVPANPVDTGQAERKGAVFLWQATTEAAQQRLDQTLRTLRDDGLDADGALGDYRPLRALAESVAEFDPDQIVISTLPTATSVWLRNDVVDGARRAYPDIPVTHVESEVSSAV